LITPAVSVRLDDGLENAAISHVVLGRVILAGDKKRPSVVTP